LVNTNQGWHLQHTGIQAVAALAFGSYRYVPATQQFARMRNARTKKNSIRILQFGYDSVTLRSINPAKTVGAPAAGKPSARSQC